MPPAEKGLPQLQVIWFAITSSVFIYAAVAFIAIPRNPDASTERLYGFVSNPISFALAIAALGAFFASYFIPGMMVRSRRGTDRPTMPSPAPARSAFELPPEIMSALIVRFALLEAPAIIGLAGAFIMGEWRFFLPFGVLSILGLLMTFPTASLVRSLDTAD